MQFLNAVWQPIDTSSRSHRCLDKWQETPNAIAGFVEVYFSLIQITETNIHQTTKESPGNSVWPFLGMVKQWPEIIGCWWPTQRLGTKRWPWISESKSTHRSDGSTAKMMSQSMMLQLRLAGYEILIFPRSIIPIPSTFWRLPSW